MSEAAHRMRQTFQVTGDKWFKIAAEEIERMEGVLRKFAGQLKTDELGEDDGDDFEGAYDAMIEEAREALPSANGPLKEG